MPKFKFKHSRFLFFGAAAFSLGLSLSAPARADWLPDEILNPPQEALFYKLQADRLVEKLAEAGVEEIGAWAGRPPLLISELKRQLQTIQYLQLPEFLKPAGATRWMAFYEIGQRRIYVNAGVRPDGLISDALALHEALGALGYAEPDYQVSFLAALSAATLRDLYLNDEVKRNYLNALRAQLAGPLSFTPDPNPSNLSLRGSGSGGGDIVGGGGDGDALVFKFQLLQALELHASEPEKHKLAGVIAKLSIDVVERTASPEGLEFSAESTLRVERRLFLIGANQISELAPATLEAAAELLRGRGLIDAR
ncbi:MAG: hypothetical protein EOP11_13415 [Proteobacteria bacterium]|nr:MAG: hypothetical protein EOP11_13415 [Pseudomonadota bacterium]